MIKDNQKVFNRAMVMLDAAITAVSFMSAYYFKFYVLEDGPGIGVLPGGDYTGNQLLQVRDGVFLFF